MIPGIRDIVSRVRVLPRTGILRVLRDVGFLKFDMARASSRTNVSGTEFDASRMDVSGRFGLSGTKM